MLFYYKNDKSSRPRGFIELENSLVRDANGNPDESTDMNAFCICTASRTWVIIAPSPEEKEAWMKAIRMSI